MGTSTKPVTTKRLSFQLFVGNYLSDLLCCASYPATSSGARFDFLDDFAARLRAMPTVTRLRSVQKAHMPVIKLTFRSATKDPGMDLIESVKIGIISGLK